MDFAALRSRRRGESDHNRDSAAEIVSNANPSATVDNLSGRVAEVTSDAAAAVVVLMRNASNEKENEQREGRGARSRNLWQVFNAGLLEVQANLARHAVPSQLFQAQLLLALHREDLGQVETGAAMGMSERAIKRAEVRERLGERRPVPLALFWRLHESGLLPLSRLLEASEALLSPLVLGQRCGCEGQRRVFGNSLDAIVHDIRALAVRSAQGDPDTQQADAAHVLSGVAKHLFDLAYRRGFPGAGKPATSRDTSDALASRAARTVLDQLCSGRQVFGQDEGTETRLRGCLSVISVILPAAASVLSCESGPTAAVIAAGTVVRDDGVPHVGTSPIGYDGSTAAFMNRQLRLLMESSSGRSEHTQGEDATIAGSDEASHGNPGLLVQILRHFPSADIIELLRSICRRAAVRAADRKGFDIHKPLLRWETLGPVVRAAATAYPQDLPPAVALIGTEMAAAAVNFIPSGDGNGSRTNGCNQQQGVLVLSAALRLVAEADVCSQGTQRKDVTSEDGLYASWVRSCFGVDGSAAKIVGPMEIEPIQQGHGQETQMRDLRPQSSDSELLHGVREAMEKQRATEILMEALCLSVPNNPAFVLEVHRDVLKTRLRAKFSVQVRDFVDLVATRLSDLKGRDDAKRRKGVEEGHFYPSGAERPFDREVGGCSDPITREVGFFLRQFKQTGVVPLALKTAILWQPKSWASFRKVLLAPPAERIAMPDDSGKMPSSTSVVVKEAIGRGENGLRVEVSLKYRRLLVQKLHKESLLSAKDHEAFRKSYIGYLQDQRDEDDAERNGDGDAETVTAVARQLMMLESKLRQMDQGNGPSTVEGRLVFLLQEYLPRALVVELCMEDDGEARSRPSPSTCGRDWFSRATSLLQQILEGWKQCLHPREGLPGRGASPEQVAEAVLNSVHCCVAAVAASLFSPCETPPISATRQRTGVDDDDGNQGAHPEGSSGMKRMLTFLDLPVAKAFQRIGEVVTLAAGMDLLGEALFRRCSNLLADPKNLDPKQTLSLAHSLAGLPPAFHGKVKNFLASVVGENLRPRSPSCGGHRVQAPTEQMAGLARAAQIGALYLQSSLLLHGQIWECGVEYNGDESRTGAEGHAEGDACGRETQTRVNMESVGFAPVILLEFCWWMERRLSLAEHSMAVERRNDGMAGLLRLLRGVLNRPLIERALRKAFRAQGMRSSMAPRLERLVALESAVSSENAFGGSSLKLMVLESVTLGRVVIDPAENAVGRRYGGITDQATSTQQPDKSGEDRIAEVWKECASCLFGDPNLRDAACKRVRRGPTPRHGSFVGIEETVRDWESYFHPAWRDGNPDRGITHWSTEGVEGVLDGIMQVMGKLCNLEAAAGSVCEKGGGDGSPDQIRDARELRTKCKRRASILLAEVLALLTRLRVNGSGPALVLVTEMMVPAIGAAEGRRKAIESLRLLWEASFYKMRPLEFGAIDRLMRIGLLWYGGRSDAEQGSGDPADDRMMRMLEDFPILGAEMVRNWTRLRCTLQPVIVSPPSSADPFGRDGWACHLDSLHNAGKEILLDLAEGGFTTAATCSPVARRSINNPGRVPLRTVKNSMLDHRGKVCVQDRTQGCTIHDRENAKAPQACSRDEPGAEPHNDLFRDAFAALPHTSAQVVIGVLHAAADMCTRGSREMPFPSGDAKRVKSLTGEPRKLEGFGSTELCEGKLVRGIGACEEGSSKAWVARLLEPMFGPNSAGPAASSLGVLLGTLVCEVGYRRVSAGTAEIGDASGGVRAEAFRSLGVSLAAAILGRTPHLVTGMAEPPCLMAAGSSVDPVERLGRSLAVLDILKILSAVHPGLNQAGLWIVVLLSHYTAALLIFVREHADSTLLNQCGWADVVAFVHAHVGSIAPQELQSLPVAMRLAAREADPLLKQYF